MSLNKILELFDEKYKRLQSSSLITSLINQGWKLSFDFQTNSLCSNAVFPKLEDIESYMLNLRFFIQNNELISLQNLKKFYNQHSDNEENIKKYNELCSIFNAELDNTWPFKFNDQVLTFRNIFEGFIYSKIAHSNINSHKLFNDLVNQPFGYYLAYDYFIRCINLIHDILTLISQLNKSSFKNLDPALPLI